MTTTIQALRFGCEVDQDSDGDWVIIPPPNVTIFSEPGEGVLLVAENREAALAEAEEYLSYLASSFGGLKP